MRSATEEPREKGEIGQIGESEGEKERERETNVVSNIQHRNENTFCGPIHQIGCGMFRVISQPF